MATGWMKVSEVKQQGPVVGQVIATGMVREVIVEETPDGIKTMGLYGTTLGNIRECVYEYGDETRVYLDDWKRWKGKARSRWKEIAKQHPLINERK